MGKRKSGSIALNPGKRCGAKLRGKDRECRAWAMANGRCVIHGGKSLAGPANPRWKHGKYSKYMPARLVERYEDAAKDPDLLTMTQEIAVVDARISDLLNRVDTGESGARWEAVQLSLKDFQTARLHGDTVEMRRALAVLEDEIERGVADHAAWSEVVNLFNARRRLVESERRRMVDLKQYITAEKALTLVHSMIEIVKANVSDTNTYRAIATDIIRLTAAPDGGGADRQ